jgi:hypothetical protein
MHSLDAIKRRPGYSGGNVSKRKPNAQGTRSRRENPPVFTGGGSLVVAGRFSSLPGVRQANVWCSRCRVSGCFQDWTGVALLKPLETSALLPVVDLFLMDLLAARGRPGDESSKRGGNDEPDRSIWTSTDGAVAFPGTFSKLLFGCFSARFRRREPNPIATCACQSLQYKQVLSHHIVRSHVESAFI